MNEELFIFFLVEMLYKWKEKLDEKGGKFWWSIIFFGVRSYLSFDLLRSKFWRCIRCSVVNVYNDFFNIIWNYIRKFMFVVFLSNI